MTAKQYLKQAYRLNELIDSDLVEIAELRELVTSISAIQFDKERVSGGNQNSKIEALVAKICGLEQMINAEIDRYVDLKAAVRKAINQLENPNERLLLRLRYVEFLPWSAIQIRMGLEERQVFMIHNRALMNFKVP